MKDGIQENKQDPEAYTMEAWSQDGTFKAKEGQEIASEIYERMLNGVPPREIPSETLARFGLGCKAGFLMGEAFDTIGGEDVYSAFGETEEGRYYYLGLSVEGKPQAVDSEESWRIERIPGPRISTRPPCPKCGSRPIEVIGKTGATFVKCPNCGLSSWGFMAPIEAHEHWDRLAREASSKE